MHGGNVSCSSTESKASTFELVFPKVIAKVEEAISNPEAAVLIHDQSKSTILVVEDNDDMRRYLSVHLTYFNTITSSDGKEAIRKLEDGLLPDLILTDYTMPHMNGYELAQI